MQVKLARGRHAVDDYRKAKVVIITDLACRRGFFNKRAESLGTLIELRTLKPLIT